MITLEAQLQVQYARAAALWQLLAMIVHKPGVFGCKNRKMLRKLFWADHQRFFKAMLMAAKVPAVAREARAALQGGFSVIIGLQSTGAANLDTEKEKSGGVFPPPTTARRILMGTPCACELLHIYDPRASMEGITGQGAGLERPGLRSSASVAQTVDEH